MTADEAAHGFRFVLFGVDAASDYFVEAGGVRSPVFRLDVADVPYVKRIDLEYRFPAYTGLSPEKHEETGDVVALKGTEVQVKVTPTLKVPAGRLIVDGAEPAAMTVAADGTLSVSFKVAKDGFYRIELAGRDGSLKTGSPDYTIDVLADQPPSVAFLKPGRDAKVTAIEEVFTELKADDDYGVGRAELLYSVNGGPEKTVVLHQGRGKKELTAGHTFFLEDLKLEPGDFISYFARVSDQSLTPQTATTDIYFMEVRPFGREYRQAEQRGAGGGGGGGGADNALSYQQRQIVAATFKLVRDRSRTPDKQYGEDMATLALIQGRLRDQVESLVRRMSSRGVLEPGSEFEKTAQSLRSASAEMVSARGQLEAKKPKEALPPEQVALKHLQRAEASFRNVQVSFEQGGGGGADSAMNAEDLADLFELELDKLKNQYETVQRGAEQQAENQVDEALERLRELARRQEQENERTRRLTGRLPNQPGGGGGGGSQRDLAEQTEDLARRLERLAREQSAPAMQETARRLQEAANAMKRSRAGSQSGALGEGAAALERLRDARRSLENGRAGRLDQGVQDALRRAQALSRAQEKIASEAEGQMRDPQGGGQGGERMQRLLERKDAQASEVADLEGQIDRMARDARAGKKDAARKLQEAGDAIRDRKLKEKIRYSKGVVKGGTPEQSKQLEGEIGSDIEALGKKLQEAAGAAANSDQEKRTAGLERMRTLVRNMESLQERLREGSPQGGSREGSSQEGAPREASERDGSARGGSERDATAGGSAIGGPAAGSPRFDALTGGGRPRALGPGEIRQLRRELQERLREAEALGRDLGGGPRSDLRDIIRRLQAFQDDRVWGEPRGLDRLLASVIEGLKSAEFSLRRDLDGPDREKVFLSGSQDLPPGWQRLVEEYYRSLSKKPGQ
jgi:hypothetical protein